MLLSRRGRAVLSRLAPHELGGRLATTTYALIASVQVWLLFALWSPSGTVWWRASGFLFGVARTFRGIAVDENARERPRRRREPGGRKLTRSGNGLQSV